jgi:hypothetical protein
LKWFATKFGDRNYDWESPESSYLDISSQCDIFEDVNIYVQKYNSSSPGITQLQLAALTLVKIRLLAELQALQGAKVVVGPILRRRLPQELLDSIHYYCAGPVLREKKHFREHKDPTPYVEDIRRQIKTLYDATSGPDHDNDPNFWEDLVESGHAPSHRDCMLQYIYQAWVETPGALEVIKELNKAEAFPRIFTGCSYCYTIGST